MMIDNEDKEIWRCEACHQEIEFITWENGYVCPKCHKAWDWHEVKETKGN